jgi:hypothetical protein
MDPSWSMSHSPHDGNVPPGPYKQHSTPPRRCQFQSKALCMIVDAPWYVANTIIRRNLQIPTVKEEICRHSPQYSARLSAYQMT